MNMLDAELSAKRKIKHIVVAIFPAPDIILFPMFICSSY